MRFAPQAAIVFLTFLQAGPAGAQNGQPMVRDTVGIPMRDGVVLAADVIRPAGEGTFPVLVYRTPYDRRLSAEEYTIFRRAVDRGYAVVIQDVRGRYGSGGEFNAYQQEGYDGFDTIEWAATQPWSSGEVGTLGDGYSGAAQWLAAIESPPHLKAMVPAMSFARAQDHFYSGGVWDLSTIGWIWHRIAPEARLRRGLSGPRTREEAGAQWPKVRDDMLGYLPLRGLPALKAVSPWYYEWLNHPPSDPWWSWGDVTGNYRRVQAAVLNLSGWYDRASGVEGAIRNFRGLLTTRRGRPSQTRLMIGPWASAIAGMSRSSVGDREMGDQARLDYDEIVLRWMDRYVRGIANGVEEEPPVQLFVMGENRWIEAPRWPPPGTRSRTFYLAGADSTSRLGRLLNTANPDPEEFSIFESDPSQPVVDLNAESVGPQDTRWLVSREDVLTFETPVLEQEFRTVGALKAEIYLAVEGPDTDLWVRVQDVTADGTAYDLMSPGLNVIRASNRPGRPAPNLLTPNRVYRLTLDNMLTGNLFRTGHRLRIQISTTFYPRFSRNLHTGDSEIFSDDMQPARITIYHDRRRPSRLIVPVME